MKASIVLCLVVLPIFPIFATDDPCGGPLAQGIRNSYQKAVGFGSNQSLRTYLMSDQFRSDVDNSDWGGALSYGSVGLDLHSKDDNWHGFQSKITQLSDSELDQWFSSAVTSNKIDDRFLELYYQCVDDSLHKVGWGIPKKSYQGGRVYFTFTFVPPRELPTAKDFPLVTKTPQIYNASDVYNLPKLNDRIGSSLSISAKPKDTKKAVSFDCETDEGFIHNDLVPDETGETHQGIILRAQGEVVACPNWSDQHPVMSGTGQKSGQLLGNNEFLVSEDGNYDVNAHAEGEHTPDFDAEYLSGHPTIELKLLIKWASDGDHGSWVPFGGDQNNSRLVPGTSINVDANKQKLSKNDRIEIIVVSGLGYVKSIPPTVRASLTVNEN